MFDAIWPLSLIQNVILTAGGEMKKKHGMSRKVKREENQEAFRFWKKIELLFFTWFRTQEMSSYGQEKWKGFNLKVDVCHFNSVK